MRCTKPAVSFCTLHLRKVLELQSKAAVIEGLTARRLREHHALALALITQGGRAVIAIRIVAGLAHDHVARPGAAGHADLGVVAAPAEAPQVVDRPLARVAQRLAALPDRLQRVLADDTPRIRVGWEARAALDGSVGLDAHRRATRAAAATVLAVELAAQDMLVRTEVADGVAWCHQDAGSACDQ